MLALSVADLSVAYPGLAEPALDVAALDLGAGGCLAVTGASGSGKSTLVNMLTGLARPSGGRVAWGGVEISALGEAARDRWRAANVGLVMQDFHLFPGLSAVENVLLPARLARAASVAVRTRAHELLAEVGLSRPEQPVETLSRGEMQRVAVARAVLREPGVIVADEPTASLDAASGAAVADLLLSLAARLGSTLVLVSHDPRLIGRASRRVTLAGGRIVSDEGAAR
jgi:putative ABC transport system ATP-binding protein